MSETKTNWEKSKIIRDFRRCAGFELSEEDYVWLRQECWRARELKQKANHYLIGHIKEEYHMPDISESLHDFIIKECLKHPHIVEHHKKLTYLNNAKPFYVHDLWCNFQKKYEFNPPHSHSGIYSFVIFVHIPYNLNEEEAYFGEVPKSTNREPAVDSAMHNHTSKFAFINSDYAGENVCDCLDVDKSFEGKMLMFPSRQIHQVFPFYTSEDYRITVSGNIRLKV
jgi:hypothetical protein|tara:strand:+ start:162 stop:836 length:675 start_codon:yes stop_codon:yes gene_type:complete